MEMTILSPKTMTENNLFNPERTKKHIFTCK